VPDSTAARTLDLPRLIEDFASLVDSSFPDIGFTRSGGEIEVRRRIPAVTCVRFELPKIEYLHLATVIIDADGLDDPIRQTTRTMSSVWNDYDQTLQQGILFDPRNRDKGFHTRKDSYPWMEIEFDQPRDLSGLRIRNVEGPNSLRERGIQIQVRTADGRQQTIYDGVARERELFAVAERFGNSDGPLTKIIDTAGRILKRSRQPVIHSALPGLVKVLTQLELRDHSAIRYSLDRLELTPAQVAEFRSLVNQRHLSRYELEWTSHGVRRSFRFWTPKQQQDYLKFTLDVITALRTITPNVCLGFGSVLSVVRDHVLMPHDDDLDVLIGFDPDQAATHAEGRQLVRDCLQASGYQVTGGMKSYQWIARPSGGPRLDVFIGVFEGERISWYPGKRGALTRAMMFPPGSSEFLGHQVPVPNRPEDYLEQIYGPGWTRPDPNFRHSWQPEQYADIAGA
jgi:hypothetical protein